jgi:hypothetical protein
VSEASKKGMVHHPVIRLTLVEEGQGREFALLHPWSHFGMQSKEGIGTTLAAESILVITELNMRAHPLWQVCEQFGVSRKEGDASIVGALGEIPGREQRDINFQL